jgi:hypothetical protein
MMPTGLQKPISIWQVSLTTNSNIMHKICTFVNISIKTILTG